MCAHGGTRNCTSGGDVATAGAEVLASAEMADAAAEAAAVGWEEQAAASSSTRRCQSAAMDRFSRCASPGPIIITR
jgi:hypothetical protein